MAIINSEVSKTGGILLVNPKVLNIMSRICRYGRPKNKENPKPHQ